MAHDVEEGVEQPRTQRNHSAKHELRRALLTTLRGLDAPSCTYIGLWLLMLLMSQASAGAFFGIVVGLGLGACVGVAIAGCIRASDERRQVVRRIQWDRLSPDDRFRLRLGLQEGDFDSTDYETLLRLDENAGVHRGAAQGQIDLLPTHTLDHDIEELFGDENSRCTICLDNFKRGNEVKTIPCMHRFHKNCIDNWLAVNAVCPLCWIQVF